MEVDRIFNRYRQDGIPSIAESAYVYSTGSTVVRLPHFLGSEITINPISEQTRIALEDMLRRLSVFGLERARIYRHKSDLRTFTEGIFAKQVYCIPQTTCRESRPDDDSRIVRAIDKKIFAGLEFVLQDTVYGTYKK